MIEKHHGEQPSRAFQTLGMTAIGSEVIGMTKMIGTEAEASE